MSQEVFKKAAKISQIRLTKDVFGYSPEKLRASGSAMSRRMAIWKATNKGTSDRVSDITSKNRHGFATEKNYQTPYEISLARYAVTKIAIEFGTFSRDMKNIAQEPCRETIETDLGKQTVTYGDVISHLKIPVGNGTGEAMIQAVYIPNCSTYRVSLAGDTNETLDAVEKLYEQTIELNNFYQGKALRFARNGVSFVPLSSTKLEDAILPKKTLQEYDMNVISFLTDPKMFEITKKRSILLYGPPGTGKTTSIKALFNILGANEVTCIFVSDESFKKFSVEDVFGFINKYLAPALVVFEDIDLIAQDRKLGASAIIGPLLSALNGIETQEKPIVIVGTTNRVDILDEAVTRPCRFDRKIKVDFPTNSSLNIMFEKRAGFPPPVGAISQGKDLQDKLTGAHIEEIYNTAALLAQKTGKDIKDCVKKSVEIVKENFFVAMPKTGFGFSSAIGDTGCELSKEDCCEPVCTPGVSPDNGNFFE